MTLNRSTEKVEFWRGLLDEQPRSGLTVKAFCELKGVSVPSFYSWRKRVQRQNSVISRDASRGYSGLVPVTVINPPKVQTTDCGECIEIVTPGGFTLTVRQDLPADKIALLLQAIEACRHGGTAC